MEMIGYLAAILMGLALGIIGGGGSILTVPILIYFFKFEGTAAATASLFVVGSTALVGGIINTYKKNVDFKTGFTFAIPSFIGVFLVRRFALPSMPDSIISSSWLNLTKSDLTLLIFAILMIFSARTMIKTKPSTNSANASNFSLINIFAKGFFVGCVTGFVGAGGGFLIVPALALFFKIPMQKAIGTSLMIISANSLFGFTMSTQINTEWPALIIITALGIAGLLIGQRFTGKMPEQILKKIFGYFILAIALVLLLDQFI
ncbi:MAG: sulfite exporter TauE/SafE family protein [Pseudobdellovibrio sp.]|nr:sulfite exporter TauE/SafE family protein [Pseudobdellovibrio sp.]